MSTYQAKRRSWWRGLAHVGLVAAALVAIDVALDDAHARGPSHASAAPVADVASASTAPTVRSPAERPSFRDGLAATRSKQPTPAEWREGLEVAPTRAGPRAATCRIVKVREWLRISCPELVTASISVLGGTPEGSAFWIDPAREGTDAKLPSGGEAQFPLRPGDRRVVQFLTFGPGYEGPMTQLPALVVQAYWLDEKSEPVLLLH